METHALSAYRVTELGATVCVNGFGYPIRIQPGERVCSHHDYPIAERLMRDIRAGLADGTLADPESSARYLITLEQAIAAGDPHPPAQ